MLEPPDHPATWDDVADTLQALDTSRTRVLDGLRAVLVVGEAAPTDGLARELRGRGGRVALIDPNGRGLEEAREIDPEVLLIDPDALEDSISELGRRIREDPRLRWASVLRTRFRQAWPHGLPLLAGHVAPLVEQDRALRTHVADGSPYRCDIERLGPNRALRAVEGLGQALKISSSSAGAVAEVVLADELLVSASWWETGPASVRMTGVEALAAFLTMRRGRLEVMPGTRLAGANLLMPVSEALYEAGQHILGVISQVPTGRYPRKLVDPAPSTRARAVGAYDDEDDEATTQRYAAVKQPPESRGTGAGSKAGADAQRSTFRRPAPSPAPPDSAPTPAPRLEMPRRVVRPTAPRSPVAPRSTGPATARSVSAAPVPPVAPRPMGRAAPRSVSSDPVLSVAPGRHSRPARSSSAPPPRFPPSLASSTNPSARPRRLGPAAVPSVRATPAPAARPPAAAPTAKPAAPPPSRIPTGRPSPDPQPVAEAAPLPPPAESARPISSLRPVAFETPSSDASDEGGDAGKWPLRLVALAAGVVAMVAVGYLTAGSMTRLVSGERAEDRAAAPATRRGDAQPTSPAATASGQASAEAEGYEHPTTVAGSGEHGEASAEDVTAMENGEAAVVGAEDLTEDLPDNDRLAARELVERARELGTTQRSEALYRAALERWEHSPRAMAGLAEIHLARGEATEAVEWARDALLFSPRRASYHVLHGDALEAAGDREGARRAWYRADQLAPGRARIRRRLAR